MRPLGRFGGPSLVVRIRFSHDDLSALRREAERRSVTVSEFIREALREELYGTKAGKTSTDSAAPATEITYAPIED
jgi:hypothetical protein